MKYLVIDACLGGTGIRDYYDGGYIDPQTLKLSSDLREVLTIWKDKYDLEHFNGFKNLDNIRVLDEEGITITRLVEKELPDIKIRYYSAGLLENLI